MNKEYIESITDANQATEAPAEATVHENGHTIAGEAFKPSLPLYGALHAIYGDVQRLEKTERNNHGNYDFAPADAFRDFIRKAFHKHGLVYFINEVYAPFVGEVDKKKTLKFTYEFVIMHVESGETTPTVRRSVFLPYVGSQTAGIASTFALKEWLKNQFLISTGEPDPEGTMSKDDEAAKQRFTIAESKAATDEIRDKLKALKDHTEADVYAIWNESINTISALTDKDFEDLKAEAAKVKVKAVKNDD